MRRLLCLVILILAVVLAVPALAQQQDNHQATTNPLVKLLQSKGILTADEAAMVNQASSPGEANQRLAQLLLSKGLITQEDYKKTFGASEQPVVADASGGAHLMSAVVHPGNSGATADNSSDGWDGRMDKILPGGLEATTDAAFGTIAPSSPSPEAKGPPVVPAFAPVRVLPVGLMGRESVKPVISAGPVHIQPYGFFKANIILDSSNELGGDAPLSGFVGAAVFGPLGPNPNPSFHLNARSSRFGANFEWLDSNSKLVITGKFEGDFEGNVDDVFNRNISGVRSNMFNLRLAWGRLDYHVTDHSGVFASFGQDWTPFCSSTLPSTNETTLVGVEYGTCYERDMMFRFGANYDFGGSRHFQVQPEFALAYPAFGNQTNFEAVGSVNPGGERAGADSNRPAYQGRIVFQFQLDKAPGVVPAQFIFSGLYQRAQIQVNPGGVPAAFKADFPGGATTGYKSYGYSAEAQLPTRWFTVQGKYWAGGALRFYFVDNLVTAFNPAASFLAANPGGFVNLGTSISGEGTAPAFACKVAAVSEACPTGAGLILPQLPIRGKGGFTTIGIPLSRLFHANPTGRNAGWTLDLGYQIDQSKVLDLKQSRENVPGIWSANPFGYKNDWGRATLNYKLNSWVLIGFEEGYYRTRANNASCAGKTPLVAPCSTANPFGSPLTIGGLGQRSWHDLHEQISTVFFF
jgi:hypothetical protein